MDEISRLLKFIEFAHRTQNEATESCRHFARIILGIHNL
jgi:hypothetical protein